jgi:hypothetical protein
MIILLTYFISDQHHLNLEFKGRIGTVDCTHKF